MTFAAGSFQQLRLGKESTWGTAPAAGTGRLVRRKTCDLAVEKETYESAEIRTDMQYADVRHGLVANRGTLTGEWSPGSYTDLLASQVRQAFAALGTTAAITTITASASGPHFVRSAGSWVSDGYKVGDMVRFAGWAAPATANNSRNYLITVLTATDMTVVDPGSATATVTAKAAGDSVSVAATGKTTYIPTTGHTDESYTFERWFIDVAQSERFHGVKVGTTNIRFAQGAMSEIAFGLMGGGYTNGTAEYFTTPTAISATSVLAGSNGGLLIAAGVIAYVRDLSVTIDNQLESVKVIGSNSVQGIVQGMSKVTGSLTAMFPSAVLRDYFLNETEVGVVFAATNGVAASSDFTVVNMPRVKFTSASKPDGQGVITQTLNFQALYNSSGTGKALTTISIQDSLAV